MAAQGTEIGFFIGEAIGFAAKDQADLQLRNLVHVSCHLRRREIYGFVLASAAGKGDYAIQTRNGGGQIGKDAGIFQNVFRMHGEVKIVLFRDRAHDAKIGKAEVIHDPGHRPHVSGVDGFHQDDADLGISFWHWLCCGYESPSQASCPCSVLWDWDPVSIPARCAW